MEAKLINDLIDNLPFELKAHRERMRAKLIFPQSVARHERNVAKIQEDKNLIKAFLKAKYASDENFQAWLDKVYKIGCKAIAKFNLENGSGITLAEGLEGIYTLGFEEFQNNYLEETPRKFVNRLAKRDFSAYL